MADSAADSGTERPDFITVGVIGKAVGLQGFCRIRVFGKTLEEKIPETLYLGQGPKHTTAVSLEKIRPDKTGYAARFSGCTRREDAEALRGKYIYVKSDDLHGLEEDEFYHFELEGMQVLSGDEGNLVGTVVTVHNYPTTDAIEVKRTNGRTVILPFNKECVLSVDTQEKKIMVSPDKLEELL